MDTNQLVLAIPLLALLPAVVHCQEECPPWTLPLSSSDNSSRPCKCNKHTLQRTIECNDKTLKVFVLRCYCITYNKQLNMTLVGRCLTTCLFERSSRTPLIYNQLQTNISKKINSVVCSNVHRRGQLCGECVEGYGPPVYSYSFQCVKCDKSKFKYNLLKYIAVAFLPLTVLYLVVIIFKVRATSTDMVAYILTCQLFTAPFPSRYTVRTIEANKPQNILYFQLVITLLGIWNLDIFRSMYRPFCIHPDMSTLHALALDYLVGVYPLVLIAVTYIAVMLHDRYHIVVRLWGPVNKFCMCIRREWDIRGSLVHAFATFFVLSYVKILNVSFDLLTPVTLHTPEGKQLSQKYLYNAGATPYFGREHLLLGVLAVVMLTVFNILPVILLFLYPCSCCHKCLNCCHLSSPALHTFMDTFQGCYHHKPKERRFFAAIYLLARIIYLLIFLYFKGILSYVIVTAIYFVFLGLVVILFKPYKKNFDNTRDASFFLWYAFGNMLMVSYVADLQPKYMVSSLSLFVFFVIPISYNTVAATKKLVPKKSALKLCTLIYQKLLRQKKKDYFIDQKVVSEKTHLLQVSQN